jgi:hypothetical protein
MLLLTSKVSLKTIGHSNFLYVLYIRKRKWKSSENFFSPKVVSVVRDRLNHFLKQKFWNSKLDTVESFASKISNFFICSIIHLFFAFSAHIYIIQHWKLFPVWPKGKKARNRFNKTDKICSTTNEVNFKVRPRYITTKRQVQNTIFLIQ